MTDKNRHEAQKLAAEYFNKIFRHRVIDAKSVADKDEIQTYSLTWLAELDYRDTIHSFFDILKTKVGLGADLWVEQYPVVEVSADGDLYKISAKLGIYTPAIADLH